MSDLIKRLRTAARKACERHNRVNQFDPAWERRPKDFIEWEAADEIKRLEREWDEDLKAMTIQWEIWEEGDKAKDAEIKRMEADAENLRNTITSIQLSLKERDAETERLRAVVDAGKDYLWCTADPPTEQMARAKLEKALAALEDSDD